MDNELPESKVSQIGGMVIDELHIDQSKHRGSGDQLGKIDRIVRRDVVGAVGEKEQVGQSKEPREYFRVGVFQKRAEDSDLNIGHRWDLVMEGTDFQVSGEKGLMMMGETFDMETEPPGFGLLVMSKFGSETVSHAWDRMLNQEVRGRVMDMVRNITPRLNEEQRHEWMKDLIERAGELGELTEAEFVEVMGGLVFESVPDVELEEIGREEMGDLVDQLEGAGGERLERFIKTLSKKVSPEKAKQVLTTLNDNVRRLADPTGKDLPYVMNLYFKGIMDSRDDMEYDYEALGRDPVEMYEVKDQIQQKFKDRGELDVVLSGMDCEPFPYTSHLRESNSVYEIVPIEEIVGGSGMKNWLVSPEESRGPELIYKYVQMAQNGEFKIGGNQLAMNVIEVDGKYFVYRDGRHRVAALKALGVGEVPMRVIHMSR